MTVWANQKGTQTAVIGTEHTLAQNSGANSFQYSVDTTNMVNGDILELRVYRIVNSSAIEVAIGIYANVQAVPLKEYKITASQGVTNGIKVTLKQTAGTGRTFDWELLADTGGIVVATNNDKTGYSLTQAFPSNFSSLSIDGSGRVDIGKTLGTAITLDANNVLNVSTKYLGGTLLTARDIGASVLLSSGTGVGQISLSSGTVTVGTNNDKTGYSLTQSFPTNFSSLSIDVSGRVDIGKILGTASAGAAGAVSIDWAQVKNPTSTVGLSGTTISTSQVVASVTGAVGSVTGAVGSVTGAVGSVTGNVGGNVTGSVGSVVAAVAITSNTKKNQALNNFEFVMTDSTTHAPKTGLTITAKRSLDGAAFASCANSASELSNGVYAINLANTDLNANTVMLWFSATGSDDRFIEIIPQP